MIHIQTESQVNRMRYIKVHHPQRPWMTLNVCLSY